MDPWAPNPGDVVVFRARSAAAGNNMGDVTDDQDFLRFGLDVPFTLVQFRAWFAAGTLSATLTLVQRIAAERTAEYDQIVATFLKAGTDDEAHVSQRIVRGEHQHWSWAAGDFLVPTWTNPNTQTWATEIHLAPLPPTNV